MTPERRWIDLGSGDDRVILEDSTYLRLRLRAGSGDDEARIANASVARAFLHGGSGRDALDDHDADYHDRPPRVIAFETR